MAKTSKIKVATWSVSGQVLVNREIMHSTLGRMRIKAVTKQGLKMEEHDFLISKPYFIKNFESLCSLYDQHTLQALYEQEISQQQRKEAQRAESLRSRKRQAQEAKVQRYRPIQAFRKLCGQAMADPLAKAVSIHPLAAKEEDQKLIRCWMPPAQRRAPSESEIRRLLSARQAEKALALFFTQQGSQVQDVSRLQLSAPDSSDWQKYDLLVDGRPIDVKNARRSEKNPDRYVSHCVPRFKESRDLQAVQIAGVLSPWLSVEGYYRPEAPVIFLGLTDSQKLEQLRITFGGGPLKLSFRNGYQGLSFLPPWLFSYPDSLYPSRLLALSQLQELEFPDETLCREVGLNPLPAFLAVGRSYLEQSHARLDDAQRALLNVLLQRQQAIGLSLPVVFLSILEHFLRLLARASRFRFVADDCARLIFPTADRSRPLFLYDPLQTVDSLLGTLETLWSARASGLSQFRMFRLQQLNILQGKRTEDEAHWSSLIAYCGGWYENPKKPCGAIPLVFGPNELCDCGKLICRDCGYCNEFCPECKPRQMAWQSHSITYADE